PLTNPSAPTTSIVVRAFTSSAVVPPSCATSARASLRPSELSFPVKTTSWPASGCASCTGIGRKMMENEAGVNRNMLLAGDIGGTKTLLGLFDPVPARPRPIAVQSFATLDYPDLPSIVLSFLAMDGARASDIDRACFGVAGPIIGDTATLTNVP